MEYIQQMVESQGVNTRIAPFISYGILIFFIILVCIVVNVIINNILLKFLSQLIYKNRFKWDDVLLERKVFKKLSNMVPGIIVYILAPTFSNASIQKAIQLSASTYVLVVAMFVISSILDSINDIYRTFPISKVRPIKGLLQVVKIAIFIIMGIVVVANLMDKDPIILLSSIGALTAVFSFVFKDSILGLVAGIQLTSNNMLQIGDWIEMPKYGADGDVIDVTLNTVKVQNFDKTIVTIPAYALVSDSFKNWRGMVEFGGRRIKRSIYIDVNSIDFCSPEMLERFKKIHFLTDYITEKEKEIKAYNVEHKINDQLLINGRHLTNIGTFRIYVQNYLKNHPEIDTNKICMVRQLPPSEKGLPIEIYAFTKDTRWLVYERVQSDIFDHIFSIVDEFGLRVFQNPSGFDIKQMKQDATLLNKK